VYTGELLIHLDERDNRTEDMQELRPNGFTEPTILTDFPIRERRVELLTRTKYSLTQTPDKWPEKQKERMELLFKMYPKIKQSYDVVNKLRAIFRSKNLIKETAREKLHDWYKIVNQCTIREIKSARDAIKSREDNVLNYFLGRSTNAAAESLNSKLKGFRAQLRGVSDLPFFKYRICTIFG